MESEKLAKAATRAREQLNEWGGATERHYHQKADEVKNCC